MLAGLCFVEIFQEFPASFPQHSCPVSWLEPSEGAGSKQWGQSGELLKEKRFALTGALWRLKPLKNLPCSIVLTMTATAEHGLLSKDHKMK